MKKNKKIDQLETLAAYSFILMATVTTGGIVGHVLSNICK